MTERIDSIYCFDYTKEIGHYDSIRDFALEEMTYIGLALSTPKVRVNSTPLSFDISGDGSNRIREYAVAQLANLNEISKELAVNSPKYILICYVDGNKRYFSYNEQFNNMFKIAFQYRPQEKPAETSPYALQSSEPIATPSCARQPQPPVQTTPTYTTPRTPKPQYSAPCPTPAKKTSTFPWGKLLLGIGVFIMILVAIVSGMQEEADVDADLTPVTEPRSGSVLSGREVYDGSEITIHAASGHSCVVKLKTRSGIERISFYVRAGDTVTVGVPAEPLYVYFASGDIWYGKTDLFGSRTSYSMDDEIFDFTRYTCEYTLYPVANGNFSETPIDADDFK